jgi:hypothetical protein
MSNVAERAAAGTDGTQNHKRRGAVIETFSKVRARGFFTDGVKAILAHRRFDPLDTRRVGRKFDFHPFRFS